MMDNETVTGQKVVYESGARRQPASSSANPNEPEPDKSLLLLTAMTELTADGILIVDGKGNILRYNQKFLKLWSIPETMASTASDRQLQAHILDQLKDPDAFLKRVAQLYAEPEAESHDAIEFKDGKIFERYSQPYKADAEIIGRVWSFRDITELSRAVEEQRRNRETTERLSREIAVIAEIGRVIGSTLNIEDVYERFAAETKKLIPFDRIVINLIKPQEGILLNAYISGLDVPGRGAGDTFPIAGSVNDVLARTRCGLLIHPENIEELAGRYPSLIPNYEVGLRSMICVPLISRDIVIGALHLRAKKPNAYTEQDLRLAKRIGAQIAGAIANAQLFIDLKESEKFLRESEARFRAIFDQAAVGVGEIDSATGCFMTVNRRLCELLRMTEAEVLATTFQALTHPEDLQAREDGIALLLAGKMRNFAVENRCILRDGSIIWVSLSISALWKPGETSRRHLIVVQDISERKKMDMEIREMSLRDQLTGLYNRRGFITLAEQQLKNAIRAKEQIQLTFIDVDDLKRINDSLGHEAGDRALLDAANVLRKTFRESDIIARLGGDEFAVLVIDMMGLNPDTLPKRLQQNIDECNATGLRRYELSLSWGAVIFDPGAPVVLDRLMSTADGLMYAQKRTKDHRKKRA